MIKKTWNYIKDKWKQFTAMIIVLLLGGGIVWVASINVLTIHSHPKEGDYWKVSFETEGLRDLIITPDTQNTINDLDFISLKCGDEERTPQILENDVILYKWWYCTEEAEIVHIINRCDHHYLKFQFGDQEAFAYNSPALIDNLLSYWKLDEASGDAIDAHGSNDGTLVNTVTQGVTGKINDAYEFEGSNDYVTLDSSIDLTGAFSFSLWFNTDDLSYREIVGAYGGDDAIFIYGYANIRVQIAGSQTGTFSFASMPGVDTWYHLVVTRDSSDDIRLYLDTTESTTGAQNKSGTFNFDCFAERDTNGTYSFDGELDEIAVWDRELTSTEISELYNSGDGLAYPFGEEEGTNMKINIGDAWKDVDSIKINIGDVWKDVEGIWINVGDEWKVVY